MTTAPTPFPELNAVLSEWLSAVQSALGDNFIAAYLQGSFAIGDFDSDSDVDFLVVIQEELSDAQLSELQSTHARIYDLPSPWAQHLEGSYFPLNALRHCDPSGAQPWYLDNTSKVLVRSSHDNTMVVRWVVRERGITLAGPDPQTLIDPVTAADLRREMQRTMRDWAEEIRSGRSPLDNCWVQTFAVLIYCRMLHTLHTGTVESKLAGARWAKDALDSRWAGLIERAWEERPNPSLKVHQPADPDDLKSTFDFIRYALGEAAKGNVEEVILRLGAGVSGEAEWPYHEEEPAVTPSERNATHSKPAKSIPDVWPPPPLGQPEPAPAAEARTPIWLPVLCLVVSCLVATILGVVVYCLGEGRRGIPVPLLLLSLGSYALVVVSIVWLCRPRK